MINYQEIEKYSYAKYIFELQKLCHIHKVDIKIIGYEKFEKIDESYPIYRIEINPKAKKRMCIMAGVQAYEIAGPLTMLELFQDPHSFFDKDVCYRIYPLLNPTSFDLRQRPDDDGVDLNELTPQSIRGRKFGEVKCFYEDIKDWEMDIFVSLHEDVDSSFFYMYVYENEKVPVYRKIIERWNLEPGLVLKDKKIYGDITDGNGILINKYDNSIEDYLYSKKMTKISLCTETPGLLPLEKRIKMNIENIRILKRSLF